MEVIKKLEQESKEYYEKWRETEAKIKEEKLKKVNLNFVGKFIRFEDPLDDSLTYLYVREIYEDRMDTDKKYAYRILGFGFDGEMYGRFYNTWFGWSFGKEIYIDANDVTTLKTRVDRITEITPEEFSEAYETHVKAMKKYHDEYFRAIMAGKNEDLTQE